jgi:RND family efflux transporter MFP subunit
MTRHRIVLLGGAGIALLAATLVLAAGGLPGPPASGDAPGPLPPLPGSAAVRVAAEGRVVARPGADIRVGTEEGGLLLRLLVVDNQAVQAGELLAEVDSRRLRETLAEVVACLDESRAEITLARLELGRREELGRRAVVSAQEVDVARRNLDIALAREAQLEARAAGLRTRIGKTRITAPIAGTVVARHADAGEIVEAGAPLVTIADLAAVRVEAEADESDAGRVAVGDPVRLRADGYPGREWAGVVEDVPGWVTTRALKSKDPARPSDTRVLAVKVAFTEPTPLRLGQTVELTILPRGVGE